MPDLATIDLKIGVGNSYKITTKGVTAFTLKHDANNTIDIDGKYNSASTSAPLPPGAYVADSFIKTATGWKKVDEIKGPNPTVLAKTPGLQGPIDDAFTDHFRCRFAVPTPQDVATEALLELLARLAADGLPFVKTEGLFTFDGAPGFSLAQGQ